MRKIKFRAYFNSHCTDLKPRVPYGTGSEWFPRWQMGVVQSFHQKKNSVRVSGLSRSYHEDGTYTEGKDSFDIPVGENCILMQFTGLCDKNKTKIFEGDILIYPSDNIKRVVEWAVEGACFKLRHLPDESYCEPLFLDDYDNFEITGNIYE